MFTKTHKTRFRLPPEYVSCDSPAYFNDTESRLSRHIWQPEVYIFADLMARNRNCQTVIDIGSGSGEKLAHIRIPHKIGVDYGPNLSLCREKQNAEKV